MEPKKEKGKRQENYNVIDLFVKWWKRKWFEHAVGTGGFSAMIVMEALTVDVNNTRVSPYRIESHSDQCHTD